MPEDKGSAQTADPFTQFWSDMMSRMAAGGMTPPAPSDDVFKQMRKPFFDALAQYADEFMRSEQFLTAMKQGMDNALAFRQQINQFLTKNLQTMQMPSSSDADHIVLVVRGMEERICDKLESLAQRVERLERSHNGSSRGQADRAGAQKQSSQERSGGQ